MRASDARRRIPGGPSTRGGADGHLSHEGTKGTTMSVLTSRAYINQLPISYHVAIHWTRLRSSDKIIYHLCTGYMSEHFGAPPTRGSGVPNKKMYRRRLVFAVSVKTIVWFICFIYGKPFFPTLSSGTIYIYIYLCSRKVVFSVSILQLKRNHCIGKFTGKIIITLGGRIYFIFYNLRKLRRQILDETVSTLIWNVWDMHVFIYN